MIDLSRRTILNNSKGMVSFREKQRDDIAVTR